MKRTEVEAMVDMTREQGIAERDHRERTVRGIIERGERENRPLTEREMQYIKHDRDVIASIDLGLKDEFEPEKL